MMFPNNSGAGDSYQLHLTPYYRRIRSRDQANLAKWYQSYREIQNFNERPLELQLRKIRVNKLLQNIKKSEERIALRNLNNPPVPRPKPKTFSEIKKELILMARIKGNEYSLCNRMKSSNSSSNRVAGRETPLIILGKNYGNTKSKEFMIKTEKRNKLTLNRETKVTNKNYKLYQEKSIISLDRQKSNDYGNYYTMREKVRSKQIHDEFDSEFYKLRAKCLQFEQSHPDIQGLFYKLTKTTSESLSTGDLTSNTSTISVLKTTRKMSRQKNSAKVLPTETFNSRTGFYIPTKFSSNSTSGTDESIVHTYNYTLDDNSYIGSSASVTEDDNTPDDPNDIVINTDINNDNVNSVQSFEKFDSCQSKPQIGNVIYESINNRPTLFKKPLVNYNWKTQSNGVSSEPDINLSENILKPIMSNGVLIASNPIGNRITIWPAKLSGNAINKIEDVIHNKDG